MATTGDRQKEAYIAATCELGKSQLCFLSLTLQCIYLSKSHGLIVDGGL